MPKLREYGRAVGFTSRFSARDALRRLGLTRAVSIDGFVSAYQARKIARKAEDMSHPGSLMQTAKRLGLKYGMLYYWVSNHGCPKDDWGIIDFVLNVQSANCPTGMEISKALGKSESYAYPYIRLGAPSDSVESFSQWIACHKAEKRRVRESAKLERVAKRLSDPEYIARQKATDKAYYARPEIACRRLAQVKARMQNPAYRARRNEWSRKYMSEMVKADPCFALKKALRARLYGLIRRGQVIKSQSALKLCGCSISELRAHIEGLFKRGMTWENYGEVWHIDHVIPCAKFNLLDPVEQRRCFNYLNLSPEFASVNISKGKKILVSSQIPLGLAA